MEEQKNCTYITKRIGSTNYKVKVCFSENTEETFEDKIIRMIANRLLVPDDGNPAAPDTKGAA